MKKYIITLLAVCALVACNDKKPAVVDGNIESPAIEAAAPGDTSQPAVVVDNNTQAMPAQQAQPQQQDQQAQQAQQALKAMNEAAAQSTYEPTGDINRDAQALVDKQLEMATRESNGENVDKLKLEVTGMMYKLNNYYTSKGKADEFKKAMGQKLGEGINKLREKM